MRRLLTAAVMVVGGLVVGASPAQAAGYPAEYFSNGSGGGCLSLIHTPRTRIWLAPCDFGPDQLWIEGSPLPAKAGSPVTFRLVNRADGWVLGTDESGSGFVYVYDPATTSPAL